VNILRQAEAKGESLADATAGELGEPAERALQDAIRTASASAKLLYEKGDYTGYLKSFAVLKAPVDAFFDKVMVMVEDDKLRRGRLALLRDLRESMNRVADLSRLAT
jgi:glycyl-tRNA synthetase beta chain